MADLPSPVPGLVIHYGFVWAQHDDAGAETARKSRPYAIVVATRLEGGELTAVVCPITHRQPDANAGAVELPPPVKMRLGLDDLKSWIITHELNAFRWPGPDLESVPGSSDRSFSYGLLPERLYHRIRDQVIQHQRAGRLRIVKRTE